MGEGVIERDIRCIRCKYNLKGLEVGGRCPECGQEISLSVSRFQHQMRRQLRRSRRWRAWLGSLPKMLAEPFHFRRKRQPETLLDDAQPHWRREMAEAALLMVIALLWPLLGMPAARLLTGQWRLAGRDGHHVTFNTPLWIGVSYLACYCVPWVLAWLAMWKTGRREFVRIGHRNDCLLFRASVRVLSIIWVLTPIMINAGETLNEECYWLIVLAAPLSMLFFLRMTGVARRAERPALAAQLFWLALLSCTLSAVAVVVDRSYFNHGRVVWWADEVFVASPLPAAGLTWLVLRGMLFFTDSTRSGAWPLLLLLPFSILVWDVAALIRVMLMLRVGTPQSQRQQRPG